MIDPPRPASEPAERSAPDLDALLALLALLASGDQGAFEAVYDRLAGPVYGLIRSVLRDAAQSEEVAQEVLLEVRRTASRFDPAKGSALAWVLTIAHRRAVDRVRSPAPGCARWPPPRFTSCGSSERAAPGRRAWSPRRRLAARPRRPCWPPVSIRATSWA